MTMQSDEEYTKSLYSVPKIHYDRLMKEKELWRNRMANWQKLAGRYEKGMKDLGENNRKYRAANDALRKQIAEMGDDDGD